MEEGERRNSRKEMILNGCWRFWINATFLLLFNIVFTNMWSSVIFLNELKIINSTINKITLYLFYFSNKKKKYIYFIFFGWKSSVIFLNELKSNLVIMYLKVILIQIIQTTSNADNHFYINVSKHKSIMFNSVLTKINFIKFNSIKINFTRRQTHF
jgi:hypothetical protein